MDRAHRKLGASLAVLLVAGTACAGPARTDGNYRSKAVSTADQARSSVETVLVTVETADRHGLPNAYVSVSLSEAEDDADAALTTFESVQPPSTESDVVRRRTTRIVGDAVALLAEARILVRRGSLAPVEDLVPELERSASQLDRLASSLEP